ncbi:hypothetical protein [Micromonospora sp. NBC_01796]|uniref:hypothetical protein n=1 Tax=Micromonospora sp. NBC_01796 TaxID=2975987 RepID=UPI002DDB8887|nr:hypothetical protein [Micromonospora sp. NBC_01796]WSA82955.1 hypothetical protein OIE47_21220 [Micromonospora sp. NBC_01796]
MPGKRHSRSNGQRTGGAAFAVPAEQREPDLTGKLGPIEVPETGAPAAAASSAPKAGPPVRGGRSGGVGRSQAARSTRQYAFRRS